MSTRESVLIKGRAGKAPGLRIIRASGLPSGRSRLYRQESKRSRRAERRRPA